MGRELHQKLLGVFRLHAKVRVTREKAPANELITNALIDEINGFNQAEIIAASKAYR